MLPDLLPVHEKTRLGFPSSNKSWQHPPTAVHPPAKFSGGG